MNSLQRSLWREWESRSVSWYIRDLERELGCERLTRKAFWEWLYTIGLQPYAYLWQKSGYYIEIRFATDADLAFYRMSIGS